MLSVKLLYRRIPDVKVILCRSVHRSYYDALGLTPKASQTDIKNAYYKLSMVFHPDKGEGNPVKFQEISTAYEVLSNHKLRKLYDQGQLPSGGVKYAQTHENSKTETTRPESSRQQERVYETFHNDTKTSGFRTRNQEPFTGKTEHFDYDTWTESHYSETFAKQEYAKERIKRQRNTIANLKKLDNIITPIFVIAVVYAIYQVFALQSQDRQREFKVRNK